ncbi:hypothetical protein MJ560_22765 [Klebsiella pneumoniae]|nr:hypothetical protein MJ560_22765 [Klebsiella pneumoniae]
MPISVINSPFTLAAPSQPSRSFVAAEREQQVIDHGGDAFQQNRLRWGDSRENQFPPSSCCQRSAVRQWAGLPSR